MEVKFVPLQAVSRVLQLIYHRNKNQHRQTTWWRWLAMVKRCVGHLIKELERRASERIRVRVEYMKEYLLPKCYVAFTQLIRDNQFAALGLTLLAELARLQSIVGTGSGGAAAVPVEHEVVRMISKSEPVPKLSEDLGEAVARSLATVSEPQDPTFPNAEFPHPQGLKYARQPRQGSETKATNQSENVEDPPFPFPRCKEDGSVAIVSRLKTSPMIAKKQRRKPANPIDEIFHGLG